jgi:GT2 family glycosyltransferase
MDVSIIIVNWNTKKMLSACLRSVYANVREINYEVIVVDNASTDGSQEMVRHDFPQVIFIENEDNWGFAAANNQGIAIAHGRYVLLLNSDTIVLDDSIANTVVFADDHPQVGIIGCRELNPDQTLQPTCFMFPSVFNMLLSGTYLYKLFPKSRFFGRERMTWWDRKDVREVDIVTGCYMLVRREAIEQVGLIDERFFLYGEETDWCYRFKKNGWKVMFAPVGQIIHFGSGSSKIVSFQMIRQLRSGILLFMKKNRSPIVYITACLLVALFFFFRVPYWLGHAVFSKKTRALDIEMAKVYATSFLRAFFGWRALCASK